MAGELAGQAAGISDCPTAGLGPVGDMWAAASQTLTGPCGEPGTAARRGNGALCYMNTADIKPPDDGTM